MPIGPQLPPHLQRATSTPQDDDSHEEYQEDEFGPSLPPHLAKLRKQRTEVGPSSPSRHEDRNHDAGRGRSRSRTPPRNDSPSRRTPSHSDYEGPSRAVGPEAPPQRQVGPQVGPARPRSPDHRSIGPARPGPSSGSVGPQRPHGPTRGPVGPSRDESLRTSLPADEASDSSDDEVGPSLSDFVDPTAAPEKSAAELFREREARMAAAPKKEEVKITKRDEWMLAPPSSGSLASLDPRQRPTSFQKSAKADVNLDVQREWTETPAEREKRLREGASGSAPKAKPEDLDRKRARERDDAIRQGVQQHSRDCFCVWPFLPPALDMPSSLVLEINAADRVPRKLGPIWINFTQASYSVGPSPSSVCPMPTGSFIPCTKLRQPSANPTQSSRGPSLMEQHKAKKSKTDEPEVIWDRDSMLGVGGLLSEEAREKKIKEARNLGDRFGHGKSGAYL